MCECVFCHKEKIITDFIYEDGLVMAIVLCKMAESFAILGMLISTCFHVTTMMDLGGPTEMKKRKKMKR